MTSKDSQGRTTRKRASVICLRDGHLLCLKVKDPGDGRESYILPGGAIEAEETAAEAAIRETFEETGYTVALRKPPMTLAYEYPWGGHLVPCHTTFFAAKLDFASRIATEDDPFIIEVLWLPTADIAVAFGVHSGVRDIILAMVNKFS